MFTGIVQALGTVAALEAKGGDLRLRVHRACRRSLRARSCRRR